MSDDSNIPCNACPPQCPSVFDRVVVSFALPGGTVVAWTLQPSFIDPRPLVFQLQVGQSANPAADDWKNVGAPVTDIYSAVDGEQRVWGKVRWQFYRVKLTSPLGVYYSDPTGLMGTLDHRDWRLAGMCLRQELTAMRMGDGEEGYLLKRRVTGVPCDYCLDPQTREIRLSNCPVCHGTSWKCGYFFPITCMWAQIDPKSVHTTLDPTRGTTGNIVCNGRLINTWMLGEEDVFVNKRTDDRYYVHGVRDAYTFRGVPIAANAELRLAAGSDPIYDLHVATQVLDAQQLLAQA